MPPSNPILRNVCAFFLLTASAHSFAHGADLPAQCKALGTLEYPASDIPGPKDLRGLMECDPPSLYYGVYGPVDYKKAKLCAQALTGYTFQSQGILAMLYANGRGGEQNFDYARKAACAAGEDSNEIADLLDKIGRAEKTRATFDICTNAKGEAITAGCALVEANRRAEARSAKLSKLMVTWSADQTTALDTLQAAEATFSDTRAEAETLKGPQRPARAIAEMSRLDDGLLYQLQQFEAGKQLAYTENQQRIVEQELKSLNAQVMSAAKFGPQAGLTADRLQQTQKAWLAYRDAWVQFAHVRYPQVSKATLIGTLTNARVRMMQGLLKDLQAAKRPG